MKYHIRKPLRSAHGTQYYRDYSDRGQGTYCGAHETEYDITHRDKPVKWNNHIPCNDCIMAKTAEWEQHQNVLKTKNARELYDFGTGFKKKKS